MLRGSLCRAVMASIGLLLAGCGGGPEGGDVKLAQGGGTVTYSGAPVAGATVQFVPEKGPIASGITDLSGNFKLASGTTPGVAIGKCVVTVTSYAPGEAAASESTSTAPPTGRPANPEEYMKKVQGSSAKMQTSSTGAAGGPKSLVPPIYAKPTTSPLSFTVDADSSKNQFKIELKD